MSILRAFRKWNITIGDVFLDVDDEVAIVLGFSGNNSVNILLTQETQKGFVMRYFDMESLQTWQKIK